MIKINKLRWKNILSFGNAWTEMTFTDGKISLVVGENGNGKSAIYEAMFFVAYGKPFRSIRKGGLVNSINGKELLVEIEIEKASKSYLVRRGIKPDVFEIFIDGKLKNQDSSVKDYQEFLESVVLQMDEKTFKQIVVLGSDFFTPFMSLSAGERRIVVEDFLNVGVYSTMHQKAKAKISALNIETKSLEFEVESLKMKAGMKKTELEKATGKLTNLIEEKKAELERTLGELLSYTREEERVSSLIGDTSYEELSSQVSAIRESLSILNDQASKRKAVGSRLSDQLSFFRDNPVCPSCSQDIAHDHSEGSISRLESEISEINSEIHLLDEKIQFSKADLVEASKRLESHQELVFELKRILLGKSVTQKSVSEQEAFLNRIYKDGTQDAEDIRREIREINREGREVLNSKTFKEGERSEYEAIGDLLKDGGIKNRIVKDYLPVINKLIKRYLDILEFPVNFTFDEDFSETIKTRGREEFSYGNFSAGERLRLDLALLFTWRELTRIKSSAYCNVLILDEIGDSSLDAAGFDAFMKILNSDRSKQAVMIISHNPKEISSRMDSVIEVSKRSGFSTFSSITENDPHEQLL